MQDQLDYLAKRASAGKLSRRDFMGKASALGVSAAAASTVFATAAQAMTPKKGGDLKIAYKTLEQLDDICRRLLRHPTDTDRQ